jgi:hypothetical protein
VDGSLRVPRARRIVVAAPIAATATADELLGPTSFWDIWVTRYTAAAREQLGGEADEAWREGENLELAEAVVLAQSL